MSSIRSRSHSNVCGFRLLIYCCRQPIRVSPSFLVASAILALSFCRGSNQRPKTGGFQDGSRRSPSCFCVIRVQLGSFVPYVLNKNPTPLSRLPAIGLVLPTTLKPPPRPPQPPPSASRAWTTPKPYPMIRKKRLRLAQKGLLPRKSWTRGARSWDHSRS